MSRLGKVWSADEGHTIAEWRNVLLTRWRATPTVEALEVSRVASHDLVSRNKGGLVVFNVIRHGLTLPPQEVRHKASAVLGETGGHVLCTATIIEGEGFWASAARAMLATITLMSRAPHPHRVFGTVLDAAQWSNRWVIGDDASPAALTAIAALLDEHQA